MSDRVDTEAVRREWDFEGPYGPEPASLTILVLCDELDRTREALRNLHGRMMTIYEQAGGEIPYEQALAMLFTERMAARAVLAESGNTVPQRISDPADTERCPTCGSRDPRRHNSVSTGTRWVECPDSWHRTTDTEEE